mmetsp:Transcript_26651/g.89697  ORF Transcript_26651/g.89697 Transcript_26651/m.89697 type:complete len:394 (-) Transcript_26651:77-1258(-)
MDPTSVSSASKACLLDFSTPSCLNSRAIAKSTSCRDFSISLPVLAFSASIDRSKCSESATCAWSMGNKSCAAKAAAFFLRHFRRSDSSSFFASERTSASWRASESTALRASSNRNFASPSWCVRAFSTATFLPTASTSRWRCAIVSRCSSSLCLRLERTSSASARLHDCLVIVLSRALLRVVTREISDSIFSMAFWTLSDCFRMRSGSMATFCKASLAECRHAAAESFSTANCSNLSRSTRFRAASRVSVSSVRRNCSRAWARTASSLARSGRTRASLSRCRASAAKASSPCVRSSSAVSYFETVSFCSKSSRTRCSLARSSSTTARSFCSFSYASRSRSAFSRSPRTSFCTRRRALTSVFSESRSAWTSALCLTSAASKTSASAAGTARRTS